MPERGKRTITPTAPWPCPSRHTSYWTMASHGITGGVFTVYTAQVLTTFTIPTRFTFCWRNMFIHFNRQTMYSKKAYLSINKAKISYIPLKQYDPYQPGLQDKHLPFRTLHVLSLQVLGHGILHSFPYTPSILHPTNEKTIFVLF